jgi:hypothetical protein
LRIRISPGQLNVNLPVYKLNQAKPIHGVLAGLVKNNLFVMGSINKLKVCLIGASKQLSKTLRKCGCASVSKPGTRHFVMAAIGKSGVISRESGVFSQESTAIYKQPNLKIGNLHFYTLIKSEIVLK